MSNLIACLRKGKLSIIVYGNDMARSTRCGHVHTLFVRFVHVAKCTINGLSRRIVMTGPVINVVDSKTHIEESGEHFAYSMTELASALGAKAIGANLTRIPPGKAAFPFHHHHGNEEHFFVISGSGVLRISHETHDIKKNDYIVNLPGGPDHAHQLINTGNDELVFLAISTRIVPEVVGYPDSGKTGVRTDSLAEKSSRFIVPDSSRNTRGYWDGEDGSQVLEIVSKNQT